MPALTAGQLTTLRSRPHTHRLRMSIINPTALLTAQVNGTQARGSTSIPYDTGTGSGFADVQNGHTLKITNQYGDRFVRVRSISGSQTSGTITVTANDIEWDDNAPLVIYENWQDYPLIARFTAGGDFFKDWDDTFTTQTDATTPVCIAGPHRVGELTGASITFVFDLNDSYVTNPLLAAGAFNAYSLDVTPSAGVTVTDNLDGTFDVEIDTPGEYWAEATVQDANLQSQTTYRRIIVHDASYPYKTNFTASLSGDWSRGGWSARIELKGAATDVQDYALVLIWQEQKFAGTEAYLNVYESPLLFAGYLKPGTARYDYDLDTVSFEAVTVEALLRHLYSHSLSLEAVPGTPQTWYEYNPNLTSGFGVHHLLKYHCTLLSMADVYGLRDDYAKDLRRRFVEVQGSDLYSMISQILGAVQAKMVTNKLGQMRLAFDAQLLNDEERAALAVVFEIEKSDTIGATTIAQREAGSARVRVSGLANQTPYAEMSATAVKPYLSKAPGDTYMPRGRPPVEVGNQAVSSQNYVNFLAGRILAREQNTIGEVRLAFDGGYADVLEVVGGEFYALSLTGSDNPLGLTWTAKNIICRSVQIRHEAGAGLMNVEAVFEPEALGAWGQTEVWKTSPPDDVDDLEPLPEPSWPELPPIDIPDIALPEPIPNTGSLITWGLDGLFVRYKQLATPDWIDKNTMGAGQQDMALAGTVDPYWTLASGQQTTNPTEAVLWRCYIGVIYRSTDGGDTWIELTPVNDPPNTWGDTTAPIVAELNFTFIKSDVEAQGTHYIAATWQEPDSGTDKWRSWQLVTTDDGQTWEWVTVLVIPASAPQDVTFDFADGADGWLAATEPGASGNRTAVWNGTTHVDNASTLDVATAFTTTNPDYGSDYTLRCGPNNYNGGVFVATGWNGNPTWSTIYGYTNSFSFLGMVYSQKVSCSGVTIYGEHSRSDVIGNNVHWARLYSGLTPDVSSSYTGWTQLDENAIPSIGGTGNSVMCYSTQLTGTVTNGFIRLRSYWQNTNWANRLIRNIVFSVTIHDMVTGPAELRIVYTSASYTLAIADDELNLYDINLSLVAKIGDCTNAEYDAGTYTAACFTPMDDAMAVFVYGRFDATGGDTGLTGVQHIIKYESAAWASVESGWSTDHCGAFICNIDEGSGRRYWAVRNTTGSCDLYSDLASLTLIGDIANINVLPDTFVILDGQTMYAAGGTGAAALIYQSTNGGTSWSDITDSHDITSGVKRMMLL